MGCSTRSALSILLGACLFLGVRDPAASGGEPAATVAPPADATHERAEYNKWLERYSRKSLENSKLVITVVADEPEKKGRNENLFDFVPRHCCYVSTSGAVSNTMETALGTKGSRGYTIPAADFEKLTKLLAKLPDDGSRLPPPGRRLIVQTADGVHATARIYDRANLPDAVLDILRLSASGVPAWLPEFKPRSEINARPFEHGGFLCLTPDGKRILFTCSNGPLQFWEPTTHETLGDVSRTKLELPLDAITFSPIGPFAVLSGGGFRGLIDTKKWRRIEKPAPALLRWPHEYLFDPLFTPDGMFLVVRCRVAGGGSNALDKEAPLQIFDARTWERVRRLPEVPEDAVQYASAAKKRRALVRTIGGAVSLWDLDRHAAVAQLDKGCSEFQAAFSPEEREIAVITQGKEWRSLRLRVWKAETGEFVREFRAFERNDCEAMRFLLWSPDGKYLLAATKGMSMFSPEGISMWNVKSGRHRGQFTTGQLNGTAILPDASELLAGCLDGRIQFFDFAGAMKKIRDFESSLRPNR